MKSKLTLLFLCLCLISFLSCGMFGGGEGRGSGGTGFDNNALGSTPVCSSGQWSASGEVADCAACPTGSTPNLRGTSCICNDSTTYYFNGSMNECVALSSNNCTGNDWPFNGTCTPCPTGATAITSNTTCDCSAITATPIFNPSSNLCISSGGGNNNNFVINNNNLVLNNNFQLNNNNVSAPCAQGTYSATGYQPCVACIGYYPNCTCSPTTGAVNCPACVGDTVSPTGTQAPTCTPCPTNQSTADHKTCTNDACTGNLYSSTGSWPNCTACANYYQPNSSHTGCVCIGGATPNGYSAPADGCCTSGVRDTDAKCGYKQGTECVNNSALCRSGLSCQYHKGPLCGWTPLAGTSKCCP